MKVELGCNFNSMSYASLLDLAKKVVEKFYDRVEMPEEGKWIVAGIDASPFMVNEIIEAIEFEGNDEYHTNYFVGSIDMLGLEKMDAWEIVFPLIEAGEKELAMNTLLGLIVSAIIHAINRGGDHVLTIYSPVSESGEYYFVVPHQDDIYLIVFDDVSGMGKIHRIGKFDQ